MFFLSTKLGDDFLPKSFNFLKRLCKLVLNSTDFFREKEVIFFQSN